MPKLKDLLSDPRALEAYKKDPFNPHAIARLRPSAFQKAIVMQYIDNLLDWGDALFGGDVLGPSTTATMLTMNPAVVPPVPGRYFALGATGYCLTAGCGTDEVELVGAPGSTSFGWSVQLVHHPSSGTTIVAQANVGIAEPADLLAVPVEVIRQLQL